LPTKWTNSISNGTSIRFYAQGQNLFILTGYGGNDVEVASENAKFMGVDLQFYPHARNIVFGINATF